MPVEDSKNKKRMSKGNVESLTSYILSLPPNEAGSKDELSVAEIFAPTSDIILMNFVDAFEELINQKGYGFTEMAQIITEKTDIHITPRQLKFHYLRNKTLKEKLSHLDDSQVKEQVLPDKPKKKSSKNNAEVKADKSNNKVLPLLDMDDYPDYDKNDDIDTLDNKEKATNETDKNVKSLSADKKQEKKNTGKTGKSKKTFGENKPGSFVIDMEDKPI